MESDTFREQYAVVMFAVTGVLMVVVAVAKVLRVWAGFATVLP